MAMQLILREDVENLGRAGDLVHVKPGYGRNYLLPKGLAVVASPHNVAQLEHDRRVIAARRGKLLKDAEAVARKLEETTLTIARATGEEDRLFGSVSARVIAEALAEQGVTVDHRKILLPEALKSIGLHEVQVKV